MQETYEFRLFPHAAAALFNESAPKQGIAMAVRGKVGDEKYLLIKELHSRSKQNGQAGAFAGWLIRRTYSSKERAKAEYFWLDLPILNSALEEGGTLYDETASCHLCGVGAYPKEPITAKTNSFRGRDLIRLLSGELIISDKLRSLLREAECQGCDMLPVLDPALTSKEQASRSRYWLLSISSKVELDKTMTRFGADPFDVNKGGACVCEAGEVAGYAPLSGLTLLHKPSGDLSVSEVFVGTRRGLLRPYQLIIVSRRLLDLMKGADLRGISAEPILGVGK